MHTRAQSLTHYARIGDASVAYQVTGEGPPDVLFIPGFISNVEHYWEMPKIPEMLHRFESFSRLIRFDKRGTGLSDPIDHIPTVDDRLDDMLAVMDAAGCEKAHLFGVSECGPLAILFAATYPERVSSLALYGAAARYTVGDDYPIGWPQGFFESEEIKSMFLDGWGSGVAIETFAPSCIGNQAFIEAWGKFQRAGASPAMGLMTLQALTKIDVRDLLPSVRVPTLLLHRTGDVAVPCEASRYMSKRIPDCKYIELAGDDHLWFSGDTDSILDPVEQFISGKIQPAASDRVLATVLFTDIVDSTKHASEMGDARWSELLAQHDERMLNLIERFRGRSIKSTGDGVLATFDGPTRALACANAARGEISPLGLQLRAGLHTGECELVGDDIAGIAVHIAARVSALAKADEVLVSSTVKDLVVGSGVDFDERGATELKGIPGEWKLYATA